MIVSPSLLSADFMNLQKEIDMINESEAQWLHFDVMDGHFVPNLSYGFPIMEGVMKHLKKQLDVHYMIDNPEKFIQRTADVGAMMMNVHYEACRDNLHDVIREIHDAGMKAGVTINPYTPVDAIRGYVNEVDMVLVMGVFPGFGGQKFIPGTIERVIEAKKIIKNARADALIEVDGGVNGDNASQIAAAGADILVSGKYIFKSPDPKKVIAELKALS